MRRYITLLQNVSLPKFHLFSLVVCRRRIGVGMSGDDQEMNSWKLRVKNIQSLDFCSGGKRLDVGISQSSWREPEIAFNVKHST